MKRRTDVRDISPHFDGEKEGVYQDSEGVEMGVSTDGAFEEEGYKNPFNATLKANQDFEKLNKAVSSKKENK
ncbi:hypothetical protein [Salirhabdus salicampi]|uniref:hypothetical protein n=1 Tax=Salirhabdus salicampi TaxID=476102 RepID=UPI0020C55E50|nr:hypothetical protein [Salirhabdus salicampi]MCP8618123.1 hypothetical protein [Salirhabdus salicampi]